MDPVEPAQRDGADGATVPTSGYDVRPDRPAVVSAVLLVAVVTAVPALLRVVEGIAEHEAEEVLARPQADPEQSATSVLNRVTLICTHMALPVMRVSVPKVMLTAPAMNGMIGGRPSTHNVTTSERMVEKISAHVPAAMP